LINNKEGNLAVNRGQSLELFYIDGHPDGMVTAELYNWTGHVLMVPRTQIAEGLSRQESRYAGIYILLGEQDGKLHAYIGEGEDIAARIKSHDGNKDWWTNAVLVTAAANKLNKAHIRYLESRLISIARETARIPLENGTSPTKPSLSEADIAKMEVFLNNLLVVLPAVRVDMFISRIRPTATPLPVSNDPRQILLRDNLAGDKEDQNKFRLQLKREDFTAYAVVNSDGEFVVLAGSQARQITDSGSYKELYGELMRSGVIAEGSDGQLRFQKNYAFKSPSAAGSVAIGRSCDGPSAWKQVSGNMTYKEWEAKRIQASINGMLDEIIK
jgi:hypothetical protein